ncbi:YncE family protein [Cellvibrio japonicus]|uniref:Thrombospondin type 3 repeat family n=1 Tax=Cellvibrio japonicus (strain Ueda107) TaxID=498211 RepID=B3PHS4_CELJU|nr:thrombospondin type 3 repeat-containing protein [Cellvibrio japonicus]ACE83275.1 Thrombospondin type 3 repeat family [Cellvibrio japonicus Ueda107]
MPHLYKGIASIVLFFNYLLFSLSTNAAHLATQAQDNLVYFLFSSPNKIVRYDMANNSPLDDITLGKLPSAFTVDGNTAYVAFNRELQKVDLTNGSSSFFRNLSSNITELVILGNFIYAADGNNTIYQLNKHDGTLIETTNYSQLKAGLVASSVQNAIYALPSNTGSSYFYKTNVDADGKLLNSTQYNSAYNYQAITRLFLNASQNKIYDLNGATYFAADLTSIKGLPGNATAMTFIGDNPVQLRDSALFYYDKYHRPLGSTPVTQSANHIQAYAQDIFLFDIGSNTVSATKISTANIAIPDADYVIDPSELAYKPEIVLHDNNDTVFLIDREHLSIFRWSIAQQKYLPSWQLLDPPTKASWSDSTNRLYVGNVRGVIAYFSNDQLSNTGALFAKTEGRIQGLIAVGNYVIAKAPLDYVEYHHVFNASGTKVHDQYYWTWNESNYLWNSTLNRLYTYVANYSDITWYSFDPNTGIMGSSNYSYPNTGTFHSLSLSNNGSLLLTSGGNLLDATTLAQSDSLSNSIQAGIWINNLPITINQNGDKLQFWNSNFSLKEEFNLAASAEHTLLNLNDRLILIEQTVNGPHIRDFDINNITDRDGDQHHDLIDNCPELANPDQEDFDGDRLGDACDPDDDNDGISDEQEAALGLNPRDASDADQDLDNDGYSNRAESLLGSNLNDSLSIPVLTSQLTVDFSQDLPGYFYTPSNALPWYISSSNTSIQRVLRSGTLRNTTETSEVNFIQRFDKGFLTITHRYNSNLYSGSLSISIDGVQTNHWHTNYVDGIWQSISLPIDAGFHIINLKFQVNYSDALIPDNYIEIASVAFEADQDGDQIPDTRDNCPNHYNPWQNDSDNDGIGDECDKDPYNQDTDGDGYGDARDNCPNTYNPDQADIDHDGIGDACDAIDNRPIDTDGDGVWDFIDNCKLIPNANQLDTDFDGLGDVCDPDIDGDGVPNELELQYSFMDPYDPSDADRDEDGDGVPNGFEIRSGFAPDKADTHPNNALLDYFPLGNMEYTFQGDYKVTIKPVSGSNRYTLETNDGFSAEIERTSTGIYYRANKINNYNEIYRYVYDNYLVMPATMKLGEIRRLSTSIKAYQGNSLQALYEYTHEFSLQLIEVGTKRWKGKDYPAITMKVTHYYDVGYVDHQEIIYLEGIGNVGDNPANLLSHKVNKIDNPTSSAGGGGGGGGNISLHLLALMLLLLTPCGRRKH